MLKVTKKILPYQVQINTKISDISGIAKFSSDALYKKGIKYAKDLLWHFPKICINEKCLNSISEANLNQIVALNLTVNHIHWHSNRMQSSKAIATCSTTNGDKISIIFFNLNRTFQNFKEICVYGTLLSQNTEAIYSPATEKSPIYNAANQNNAIVQDFQKLMKQSQTEAIEPHDINDNAKIPSNYTMIRPLWKPYHNKEYTYISYGIPRITDGLVGHIIKGVINNIKIDEPASKDTPNFIESLQIMHSYHTNKSMALKKLKFDEALVYEYGIYAAWQNLQTINSEFIIPESDTSDLLQNFEVSLTDDQSKCFEEIKADLMTNHKMMRILYGDVGCGKSIVAFLALLMTYRAQRQAAILVPTSILAKQHYELLKKLLPKENIVLLTSTQKTKNALKIIENENCIIVGTHSLLQDKVKYKNLGLLVVDEQHRFGVLQRMLIDRGMQYNVLLMTATPIPRTLKLSFMGYIPISKIMTRPQKHRDIKVEICSMTKIEFLIHAVKEALKNNDSVFWVCPNIEEENKRGGMSVYTRGKILEEHFSQQIGILHGRMSENDKDAVLEKFYNKEIKILVTTTVIEVGVNIPHANMIIIDNSEYFGMAQLYQLIGRVGRGAKSGLAYLTYSSFSLDTKLRLLALKECKQGIDLAEKDMYVRGFGNLLGEAQSGDHTDAFKCLDMLKDSDMLSHARLLVNKNIHNEKFCEMLQKKADIFSCLQESWTAG